MVSTADTPPIIGRDLINALELGVQGSSTAHGVQQYTSSHSPTESASTRAICKEDYTPLLCEFPALSLDTLGVFPDFQHQIELKPDTLPVTCRSRLIPLVLHEGVE